MESIEVSSMEDETVRVKEVHDHRRLELEERVLKAEEKCIELETELEKRKKESESLKTRVKELESEKLVMEEELRNLKESDENSLIEQKMENNASEIKKQVTENKSKNEDGLSMRGLASDVMDTLEERSSGENYEDEDVEATSTCLSGRKRKHVITSDSENDDEDADNLPISVFLKKIKQPNQEMQDLVDTPTTEENMSKRVGTQRRVSSRLKKQRESKEISASSEQNTTERIVGISTTGNAEDDETDEELEREGESLDGFIVDDDIHETASEKSDAILDDQSDGETSYADIMSRLRRDKPKKRRWEYEADMLADFGKDPELCMKAVCVLYRFQTEDEKMSWSSHVDNGRGFSQVDAIRGTRIGKFLTDGDPQGDLKKSVEELESFEFDGVEICRALAERYSKQLFQIYNNREDPFFTLPPSL